MLIFIGYNSTLIVIQQINILILSIVEDFWLPHSTQLEKSVITLLCGDEDDN